MKTLSPVWAAVLVAALMALMVAVGMSSHVGGGPAWLCAAVLMTGVVAVIGLAVTGRPAGVLVSPQNLISLSRFQAALWTILLLSGWATVVLRRMGEPDPLAVALDPRLWALMGISTTSLVGTPLLLSVKMGKDPAPGAAAAAAAAFQQAITAVEKDAAGLLYRNASAAEALFTDMFGGDELGDTATVDLAKVQMFFATLAAAGGYAVSLYRLVDGTQAGAITSLPVVATWLVTLLGVSHGGYLASKTARQTPVRGEG